MELAVGRVVKTHGVRGELVVEVRTDEPDERFAPGAILQASGGGARYTIDTVRWHSGRLLMKLAEVPDRSAAEALRGTVFVVDSGTLPPTEDPDEFYDHELEGLSVRLVDGTPVGTVTEVLHSGAGELLSIDSDGREVLVPFVSAIVTSVSLSDGIVIDPPEGLLE